MQKDVIQKIDLLVEMSDTNNSYDTLKEELRILEVDIARTKDSIHDLTRSMVDSKYIRASDRIIDENIKISLENKLANYDNTLKEIKKKIAEVSKEEEEYHQMILELEAEIKTSEGFLESLELKLKTIGGKDKSIYSFYEDLIDTTTNEIKSYKTKLQVKKKAAENVEKRLESLAESRVALEEKIKKDSLQLEETEKTLSNPKSYIDESQREQDEKHLKNLNEALETLEKRRLEIITDAAYIGHEATELLINDDRTSTLSKAKELLKIVEARPYMDFRYDELDEVLEGAIQKRDEFANLIENKKYDGTDKTVLDKRIEFLKTRQEVKEKEKSLLEQQIRDMDTDLVRILMNLIAETKKVRDELKADIEEYKKVMEENNEYKTPKKKASLTAAFNRKCEELEQVNTVIASYEKDLETVVTTSKVLEEKNLSELNNTLSEIEAEIASIEKKQLLNNLPKDILAVEKDKSELKKLSDEVESIIGRKKYLKMPRQILDEIEMSLGAIDEEEESGIEEEKTLSDYRIEASKESEEIINIPNETEERQEEIAPSQQTPSENTEKEEYNVDEVPTPEDVVASIQDAIEPIIPEQMEVEPMTNLEELISESNAPEEEEEMRLFPPRNIEPEKERFKVISVEPIDDEPVEELENDDYMVNDFQDTDYISFNDLLEGGNSNEN